MHTRRKQRLFKPALSALTSAILFTTPAMADADFIGSVTNDTRGVFLKGALAEIESLGLKAVSGEDGRFRFKNLPAGTYKVKVTYLGAQPAYFDVVIEGNEPVTQTLVLKGDSASLEEVLVVGQRASQASALNRQKNSNKLVSVVSSDAIGQFPDQNVAEALQRLPGVAIQRDQGEGRFVSIRGIDPNLNNLQINGLNVPSPESGVRSVAMDVIPSELVGSLEVSKTVTPDMDADAVGGSINVKSLSAFDRADGAYSVTAQYGYTDLRERDTNKLSGSYSGIFELEGGAMLGVAAAASWHERRFGSDNVESDGGWGDLEVEDAQTGEDVEIFGTEELEQRYYLITRERTGLAVNFDLQQGGNEYYWRTLYSEFEDDEYRLRNEYKFSDGALLSATNTSASYTGAEMDRDTKDRYEEQTIFSTVLGGEIHIDAWTIEASLGYSESTEEEPNRIDADFAGEDIDMAYLSSGPNPALTQSDNVQDLSNFELDEIVFEDNLTEDEETTFRIDFTRDFVWKNYNGAFQFGTKYRQREKFNRLTSIIYDGGFNDATAANFAAPTPDYQLGDFGPGIDRHSLREFFDSNRSNFDIDGNSTLIDSQGGTFDSEEDIFAAYAMVSLDLDRWSIVAGVRYEDTDFKTNGNSVELVVDDVADEEFVNIEDWQVSRSYDHLLPSLNVRYEFSDKLVSRFAFTQTIARPTFENSAAFQLIETESELDEGEVITLRRAEVGNPDLDPYESDNLDLSIEYYPGSIGVLSAGLFYKDISNFIVMTEVQDQPQWAGFEEVIQPVNGGNAELTGIELAWTKSFDSGLLIIANATFTDADTDSDVELPNQSDTVGNIALGYESQAISARLTLSHKSEAFQFYDQGAPVYQDDHNQVDFNAKYFVNDNLNLYFNAVNLNDEELYLFHRSSDFSYQFENYGRTFEFGVTWSTF